MIGRFFGEPWPSGICDEGERAPTPAGELCLLCDEPIQADDQGSWMIGVTGLWQPVHRECSLRSVLGGIGHMENHLKWCVEMGDPDGGHSYRESALLVWRRILHEEGPHRA